ncbi:c-type cytochrome [Rhodocyclus tenuis]|uniref:Cytochrome c553 n=1 Tax=Rhodocyclus tenuis TaxID=1066 RepID=A0A840G339_RHOTE|nr:c-type cytochrome [Rhodocyclus tenuis]MBB4248817.1 cytochrome c553 [Rhodocyclus tenuis]
MALPAMASDVSTIATTVCFACHGENGNSITPIFPKIAGQQRVYITKQLKEFASGKRANDIMVPIIQGLSDTDMAGLGAWFSEQKAAPGKVEDGELAMVGKRLFHEGNVSTGVPACEGCHQADGEGNERYPRLAGQHQAYSVSQLNNFKNGTRANDRGKVMRAVAERLSEDEMKAVAEYIAGL